MASQISIPNVSQWATEDQEALAGRIDRAFDLLEQQLRNFEASSVSNADGSNTVTLFYQTFEEDIEDTWNMRDRSGTITYPTDGSAGGRVLQADGDRVWAAFPENIPFDPARLYRLRARFKMTSAPSNGEDDVKVGFEGVASDGSTLVNTSGSDSTGSQHWATFDAGDEATVGNFFEKTLYIQGRSSSGTAPNNNPQAPGKMHEDVRYWRPVFVLNSPGGDGTQQIDYISLEIVTESKEMLIDTAQLADGAVEFAKHAASLEPVDVVDSLPDPSGYSGPKTVLLTTDSKLYRYDSSVPEWTKVVDTTDLEGTITETQISDDAVSTPKLQANAVTANEIAADTITANELAANTITAGEISAGAIKTDELAADSVVASKISVSTLSAITADVGTLTAGTIQNSGGNFVMDLDGSLLRIDDQQATPKRRVNIGKLGTGSTDWGIEVFDSAGNAILTASGLGGGVVDTNQLVAGAVTATKISVTELSAITADVGTLTAGLIQGNNSQFQIDLDTNLISISDGTRIRFEAGEVAAGVFGVRTWDSAGNLLMDHTGGGEYQNDPALVDFVLTSVSDDGNNSGDDEYFFNWSHNGFVTDAMNLVADLYRNGAKDCSNVTVSTNPASDADSAGNDGSAVCTGAGDASSDDHQAVLKLTDGAGTVLWTAPTNTRVSQVLV